MNHYRILRQAGVPAAARTKLHGVDNGRQRRIAIAAISRDPEQGVASSGDVVERTDIKLSVPRHTWDKGQVGDPVCGQPADLRAVDRVHAGTGRAEVAVESGWQATEGLGTH